jgi:hypothetical protein
MARPSKASPLSKREKHMGATMARRRMKAKKKKQELEKAKTEKTEVKDGTDKSGKNKGAPSSRVASKNN